ncbi:hypothetical protein ACFQY5_41270 [Paeniroseomonas aquatica]|uniref:Uncharacterized protein n=1 Tax=Paeniroseomonas aquatica TaxID=373043 RepID=A0ABT8AFQ8_9PROT|nr:hypothetical protein [Paeniroseomonas aquatica]MDN3568667.1 hypothetical protein [Paeniroseomonas aquatica]
MPDIYITSYKALIICKGVRKKIEVMESPGSAEFAPPGYSVNLLREALKSIEDQYLAANRFAISGEDIIICLLSKYQEMLVDALFDH